MDLNATMLRLRQLLGLRGRGRATGHVDDPIEMGTAFGLEASMATRPLESCPATAPPQAGRLTGTRRRD